MEVYATQPSSEVLKCQQHVVVPNLRLHHHHHTAPRTHHLQLPKLQIGSQSISAPASPSCGLPGASAANTPPTFTTSSAPSVEMKRSYEQTKEPASSRSSSTKRSVVVNSANAKGPTTSSSKTSGRSSLPLVTPCHKDKMAAAAAANASGAGAGAGLNIANTNSKMGFVQTPAAPSATAKSNGNSASNNNNNNNGEAVVTITVPPPTAGPKISCEKSESESEKNHCDSPRADVFLGGSCNPTTWRTDKAIPLLKKLGISYYNPQVATWCPELISLEHEAKTHAKCLLFVIDSQTRSVVGLIEVAFLAAQGRKVVLVLPNQERTPGQSIMGEEISQSEFEELSRAHSLLKQLVERHQLPVFNDLDEAIHCIAKILQDEKDGTTATGNTAESATNSLENNLKNVFESLMEPNDNSSFGEVKYSQMPRAYRLLTKSDLAADRIRPAIERCSQHISRSQSSSSTSASTSSGDDSPPLKKDLVGEERFKPLSMTNGRDHDHDEDEASRTIDCINFEEFKYLMTELLNGEQEPGNSTTPARFLQRMKDLLERLMDSITDADSVPSRLRSYDVYLSGGASAISSKGSSDSSSSWLSDKAIPLLKTHNLTHCSTDYITAITKSKESPHACPIDDCRVLFIYLNNSSRAVELMTLASYYIGLDRHRFVFCIEDLQDDCQSGDEKLTKIAIKDYNRGRAYISDIAKRNEMTVYSNLDEALQKVVELCKHF